MMYQLRLLAGVPGWDPWRSCKRDSVAFGRGGGCSRRTPGPGCGRCAARSRESSAGSSDNADTIRICQSWILPVAAAAAGMRRKGLPWSLDRKACGILDPCQGQEVEAEAEAEEGNARFHSACWMEMTTFSARSQQIFDARSLCFPVLQQGPSFPMSCRHFCVCVCVRGSFEFQTGRDGWMDGLTGRGIVTCS